MNMDSHYRVDGYGAIAWYVLGYATEWTPEEWIYDGEGDPDDDSSYIYSEPEEMQDTTRVRCVMVGDDRVFDFGTDELTEIPEESFCRDCGQIGCGHNVYA